MERLKLLLLREHAKGCAKCEREEKDFFLKKNFSTVKIYGSLGVGIASKIIVTAIISFLLLLAAVCGFFLWLKIILNFMRLSGVFRKQLIKKKMALLLTISYEF